MKKLYIQPECSIVALAGDIIATSNEFNVSSNSLDDLGGYRSGIYNSASAAKEDGISVIW